MFIASSQVPDDLGLLLGFFYALLLLVAVRYAAWRRLWYRDQLNLFVVACLGLFALWSLRAGVSPGMALHYLGVTTLTLMFGWPLALVGTALVLAGMIVVWGGEWNAFALNAFVVGALPVLVTQLTLRLSERYLPAHFFIYIYICAFLGAALAMLASVLLGFGLLGLGGAYSVERMSYEYLAYLPLLVLPEAILNGMVMTALVLLRPRWVATFDEDRYLKNR